jgi:chromosomal replication initiator protein
MGDKNLLENKDYLWGAVRETIKAELSQQSYKTWIEPLSLYAADTTSVTVAIPNSFFGTWLRDHYHDLITSCFAAVLGEKPELSYFVVPEAEQEPPVEEKPDYSFKGASEPEQDSSLSFAKEQKKNFLTTNYTFDTFVVGAASRFAHAAAIAVSEAPAKKYNPLFIYGPVGLGKTHLLQAIAHNIQTHLPALSVLYISSEKFTNMLINAIQKRSTIEFRKKFRNVDLLLIDDIHFIAGKEATQEEFFHTFNDLYDSQKQIVLTSDRPPKDIPFLEERLISRFEWGLITDIQPPDFETRVAILKKKMERETVCVPDDVAYFIANNIKSNIRELEGSLIRVVAYSSLIGRPIDLALAKEVLKDTFSEEEKKITIDIIQQKAAEYFHINLSDMRTKKRSRSIAYPRQIAMYLVRSLTEHSLPEIGEFFGGRDHTTVMHAISKIDKELKTEVKTRRSIDDITALIKGR